jgi:hypothetical protein
MNSLDLFSVRALMQALEQIHSTLKAHDVHAHIAREQHSSRTPQQRDLSRAMPRSMNNFDAPGDGQYFPISQRLVDGDRRHSLVMIVEQPAHHLPQQAGCRAHRPKRTSTRP